MNKQSLSIAEELLHIIVFSYSEIELSSYNNSCLFVSCCILLPVIIIIIFLTGIFYMQLFLNSWYATT